MDSIVNIIYSVYNCAMEPLAPLPKYQSNNLRILLLAAGVVMLFATPFQPYVFTLSFQIPTYIATIICVMCAGIINRRIPYFFIVTGVVTLALLILFQLSAIMYFRQGLPMFVMVDELIALLLFFAAYYAFRSYREVR